MFILSFIMYLINQLDLKYYKFLGIINGFNLINHIYQINTKKQGYKIREYLNKNNIIFFFYYVP